MARYRGPRLKIIRRLGTQLPGLMRSEGDLRRPYPPGQHGPTRRAKLSDYAVRLREKQKLRFHYGISEKQFRRYVSKASSAKGNPGTNLLQALETRLDNAVFRAGMAPTVRAARQMAGHGHFVVNGKRVDIPSYPLRVGDVISIHENSKMREQIKNNRKDPNNLSLPSYIEIDDAQTAAKITMKPAREDIPVEVLEQFVIEYYSGR
ncbi:MAG: 30S ribosomal protein S4 [Myxococcales bacterium]|nr:30S ribosomal protein S4 [Myxococcales bacterium]USN51594.1 MAG: 30S ribosomal protein S4 [Myxococcales bacterium]